MNAEINGVHYDVQDHVREYAEKKIRRLDFARDLVVDLPITLTKGKKAGFELEAMIHFRWGKSRHVGLRAYDVLKGIDELIDKTERVISREKEKIQHHKGGERVPTGQIVSEVGE